MPSFSCNEIFITKWGSFDSEDGRYILQCIEDDGVIQKMCT